MPTQPLSVGVTVTVDVMEEAVVLVAVKAGGLPGPPDPRPTAALLLDQAKVVPVNGPESEVMGAVTPAQ